jgi:hypothetical protein
MAQAVALLDQKFEQSRQISTAEGDLVRAIMAEFTEMTIWRNTYAGQLEETAALLWPEHRNTFYYGSFNWPGMKKTQQQVDASGMLALHRFAAIADSLLTPANYQWHAIEANDDYVMKDRATRLYFAAVTQRLFKSRRNPIANFRGQNNANWSSLGAFGNASMYIDAFDGRNYHGARGPRYCAVPFGETFFGENHQGLVDRMIRWFRRTAYQAAQRWGDENLPPQLQEALKKNSQWPFNFLHCVKPRNDYDPERLDAKGLPFSSHYVSIEGQCLMQAESGYRMFPYAVSRYMQAPREVYGRGPAQMVLPALKTLNAQKATFLKQAHRSVDLVLLGADDGLTNFDFRPGAYNRGGVNKDGKPLVHALPTGNIQIAKEMMAEERSLIDDMFLVTLYKVLSEHPNMTATQVIELVNEKGILVAPTLGRQETEYLGPMIEREIDVHTALGMLPPMPPRLKEARGEYQVVYTSPLALSQRAGKAAGFMRVVETSKEIVNITQDPSYLDWANFDVALPAIARDQSVDEAWINSDRDIVAKRQNRAKQKQTEMAIQALPNQAAMISAQAKMAKAQPGVMPGQPGLGGPQQPAQAPVPA